MSVVLLLSSSRLHQYAASRDRAVRAKHRRLHRRMRRVGQSGDKLRGSTNGSSSAKIGVIQQHTMEIAEILHDIERNTGRFARAAVEAAVSRREEVTPELLRILEEVTARTAELPDDDHYMAHLYAMLLLAQ